MRYGTVISGALLGSFLMGGVGAIALAAAFGTSHDCITGESKITQIVKDGEIDSQALL